MTVARVSAMTSGGKGQSRDPGSCFRSAFSIAEVTGVTRHFPVGGSYCPPPSCGLKALHRTDSDLDSLLWLKHARACKHTHPHPVLRPNLCACSTFVPVRLFTVSRMILKLRTVATLTLVTLYKILTFPFFTFIYLFFV